MDTKQLVKNKILLTKVAEYFAKHPKKDSVVVKADFGESKIYWRAVREAFNKFSITEVKTVTERFIFEINNSGAQPAGKTSKAGKSPKAKPVTKTKAAPSKKADTDAKPLMTIQMVTQ